MFRLRQLNRTEHLVSEAKQIHFNLLPIDKISDEKCCTQIEICLWKSRKSRKGRKF